MRVPQKLSLDRTWEECLDMWRWIASVVPVLNYFDVDTDTDSVDELKRMYLENRFKIVMSVCEEVIDNNCWFCQYDDARSDDCGSCPGRLVEKDFHCDDNRWRWCDRPVEFLAKLEKLNKIRLAKKGKK